MRLLICLVIFCFSFISVVVSQNFDNYCGWEYVVTSNSSTIAMLEENFYNISSTSGYSFSSDFGQNTSVSTFSNDCTILIGVFYEDDNNELACGGYSMWGEQNFAIAGWGDDSTTPIKDGFSTNEEYIFKLCVDSVGEILGSSQLMIDNPAFTAINYIPNGLSGVAKVVFQIPSVNNLTPCSIDLIEENKNKLLILTTDIYGRVLKKEEIQKGIILNFYNDKSIEKLYKF